MSFNFMAVVMVHSDFGTQENKTIALKYTHTHTHTHTSIYIRKTDIITRRNKSIITMEEFSN